MGRAFRPAMNPQRQSAAEAYRVLEIVLTDLQQAERALATSIENTPPDPVGAASLATIRATIAKLQMIYTARN
jgi:hypothetical protein